MEKELLKSILADNQAEIQRHNVVKRDFTFEDFNYVFVGIRRAGKTYLLYQRIQELVANGTPWDEILYINFEDERLEYMTSADFNLLLEAHYEMYGKRPILFLDEIQNIKGWEKFARRLSDEKYRVYITGSNTKMLSSEIRSTLGGRFFEVEVYPFNFEEYLCAKNIPHAENDLYGTESKANVLRIFDEYFHYGGFPEAVTIYAKRDYVSSIYNKILLGDIATRYSVQNVFALKILFKKIAESVGQPISFSRLTNILSTIGGKIAKMTVINYIEYAKNAWLLTALHNIGSKIAEKESSPKYYFTDNGVLNLFLLDPETSLLENLVAVTLLRKYGRENAVFFYNRGIEVDFYVPEAELAIQACYTLEDYDTYEREVKALEKLSAILPCQKLLIITRNETRTIERGNVTISVLPIWKWLLSQE